MNFRHAAIVGVDPQVVEERAVTQANGGFLVAPRSGVERGEQPSASGRNLRLDAPRQQPLLPDLMRRSSRHGEEVVFAILEKQPGNGDFDFAVGKGRSAFGDWRSAFATFLGYLVASVLVFTDRRTPIAECLLAERLLDRFVANSQRLHLPPDSLHAAIPWIGDPQLRPGLLEDEVAGRGFAALDVEHFIRDAAGQPPHAHRLARRQPATLPQIGIGGIGVD
jgi:hypothetical protein